ncbi:hypothetical protein HMPREF9552_03723, partial [Escherichia coli MS 198-1]
YSVSMRVCTVYPRGRGELSGTRGIESGPDGLSPLARGTH